MSGGEGEENVGYAVHFDGCCLLLRMSLVVFGVVECVY